MVSSAPLESVFGAALAWGLPGGQRVHDEFLSRGGPHQQKPGFEERSLLILLCECPPLPRVLGCLDAAPVPPFRAADPKSMGRTV